MTDSNHYVYLATFAWRTLGPYRTFKEALQGVLELSQDIGTNAVGIDVYPGDVNIDSSYGLPTKHPLFRAFVGDIPDMRRELEIINSHLKN